MKKRCQKGKSCGVTCIERADVCRLDLGPVLSKGLGEVSGEVQKPEPLPKAVSTFLRSMEEGYKALHELEKQNLPSGEWDWRSKEVNDKINQSRDKALKIAEGLPEGKREGAIKQLVEEERKIRRSVYTEEGLVKKITPLVQQIIEKRKKNEDFSDLFRKASDLVDTLTGEKQREMVIKLNLSRGKRFKIDITHSSESRTESAQAGKDLLSKYTTLEKAASVSRRYDAVLESISKRFKKGGLSEEMERRLEAKMKEVAAKRQRAEDKVIAIMEKVRRELLETPLTDRQVNDLISRVWVSDSPSLKIKNDAIEFIRMFNGRGFTDFKGSLTGGDVKAVRFISETTERAKAKIGAGGVYTDRNKRTTFHELAHIVEAQRPWMSGYAVAWRNSRGLDIREGKEVSGNKYLFAVGFQTAPSGVSVPLVKLRSLHLDSGYRDDEIAVVDKFASTYMGKVYLPPGGGRQTLTEVWSTAFELFADSRGMATFYKAHPDLFEIVAGLAVSP